MNAPPDQPPNPFPTEILASMFTGPEPTEVIAEYVWGARPGHRDDLVRRDRYEEGEPVERLYCLMDYFNPVAVIDAAGEVQERYAWSAFGLRTVLDPAWEPREESALGFEIGFHGQFCDGETGYYNYGFRYYSPEAGRWLSRDPIGEEGGINIYAILGNAGVNGVDWLGLTEAERKTKKIGIVIGPNVDGGEVDERTIPQLAEEVKEVYGHHARRYSRTTLGLQQTGLSWHSRHERLIRNAYEKALEEYAQTGKACCTDFELIFAPGTLKDDFVRLMNSSSVNTDYTIVYGHGEPMTEYGGGPMTGILLGFAKSVIFEGSYWAKPFSLEELVGSGYKQTSLYVFSCFDGGHPLTVRNNEVSVHLLGPGSDGVNLGGDFQRGFKNLIKSECCEGTNE